MRTDGSSNPACGTHRPKPPPRALSPRVLCKPREELTIVKQPIVRIAFAAAISMVLAACSSGGPSASPPAANTAAPAVPAATTAPAAAAATTAPAAGGALSASDVGVTKDSILIG